MPPPSPASLSAWARPIPPAAPVMSATFPSTCPIASLPGREVRSVQHPVDAASVARDRSAATSRTASARRMNGLISGSGENICSWCIMLCRIAPDRPVSRSAQAIDPPAPGLHSTLALADDRICVRRRSPEPESAGAHHDGDAESLVGRLGIRSWFGEGHDEVLGQEPDSVQLTVAGQEREQPRDGARAHDAPGTPG